MNRIKKVAVLFVCAFMLTLFLGATQQVAFAQTQAPATETQTIDTTAATADSQSNVTSAKAYASAIAIGLTAGAAAIGMGVAIKGAVDGISRQPEAEGKIRTSLMLGLVFVETVVIYALIIAILVIFVL